jgi:hypothetical protein
LTPADRPPFLSQTTASWLGRSRLAIPCLAFTLILSASPAQADCPAAPLTSPDDLVVSFRTGEGGPQASPGALLASTEKDGMLVYDGAAKSLKLCDGTSWITLQSANGAGAAAGSVAGAVQFRGSGGNLAADDANLVWDDTNNRLGIGTAAPLAAVDVAGGVKLGSEVACSAAKAGMLAWNSNTLQVCTNAGTFTDIASSAGGLSQWLNGGSEAIYYLSGNVGIGTSSPEFPFDINSTNNAAGGHIFLRNAGTSQKWGIIKRGSTWASPHQLLFSYNNGSLWSEILKLEPNGNVSIGTTAIPQSRLVVNGGIQRKRAGHPTFRTPARRGVVLGHEGSI